MSGKVYTLKPDVAYKPTTTHKEKAKEEVSLKEKLKERFEAFLLLLMIVLLLVSSVGVAYKSMLYFELKNEKRKLLFERAQLEELLNRLTSREILLEKAKKLGLRQATDRDTITLK